MMYKTYITPWKKAQKSNFYDIARSATTKQSFPRNRHGEEQSDGAISHLKTKT